MEQQHKSKADREIDAMVQRVMAVAALLLSNSDEDSDPNDAPAHSDDHEA